MPLLCCGRRAAVTGRAANSGTHGEVRGLKKGGRPSSFLAQYVGIASKLARMGATDADLAEAFGVAESTINNWKERHPEFVESLKAGKDEADATVVRSLFERANGYSHPAVKIFCTKDGGIVEAPYTEHYAPDTTACIFWLKNRRPNEWRDQQVLRIGDIKDLSDDELAAIAAGKTPK